MLFIFVLKFSYFQMVEKLGSIAVIIVSPSSWFSKENIFQKKNHFKIILFFVKKKKGYHVVPKTEQVKNITWEFQLFVLAKKKLKKFLLQSMF